MALVTVSIEIDAPQHRVWREVSDLGSHPKWMADARSVKFLTDQRAGIGTRMEVATRIGPLRTNDVMVVVGWEESRLITMRHRGLVTGMGSFRLHPLGLSRTRFTWEERLDFPWRLGGPPGEVAAAPLLTWVWRRNLRALKRRLEG